jgi:flagellar biosynthesis protein FliP
MSNTGATRGSRSLVSTVALMLSKSWSLSRGPRVLGMATLFLLCLSSPLVWAQTTPLGFTAQQVGGTTTYSVPVQTLLVFSALSFLPAALLLMTSFTRIIIVLSLLRQALGLQTTPPNQVLVGMSLFLTFFVMGPTFEKIHDSAYKPFNEQKLSFEEAVNRGAAPLRTFMLRQTREADLALFFRIGKTPRPANAEETPMRILIPAFVTSELKTAFQIGFMVFVPFIVIDLIVASVLMSMGMMMLSPVLVALPFKLMLFVLADGWNLLMGSLVASFGVMS